MFEQQMILRGQWEKRNGLSIENERAGDRVRYDAERRKFRSDARLRAEREEDQREWVNSAEPRKREDS
jgi:hypothetical protein